MFSLTQRHQSYLWLILNTIVWGAAFVISKPAFEVTTPFRFLFYRFFIAATLVIPLLWRYRKNTWNNPRSLLMISGLEMIGTTCTLIFLWGGLALTSAIEANMIATTAPIFVVLLGVWWLKEKQEAVEWWGIAFALFGTICVVALPVFFMQGIALTGALLGNISIVIANISESVYFVLAKKRYQHIPKLLVVSVSFYIGLFSFAILSLAEAGWSVNQLLQHISVDLLDMRVILGAGYMAVFGSIIGLTAYIQGQNGIEASEAAIFRYLQPIIYIPLGIWLLHEELYAIQALSLVIIIIGFILSEQRDGQESHAVHARHGVPANVAHSQSLLSKVRYKFRRLVGHQ
ncbi:MAG: DMT family transporter [Patescibacteria group bacterium]